MLEITSDIEGKRAYFGDIRESFEQEGFHMNGGWEYHKAYFDTVLFQNESETIYLRVPAHVLEGKLDHDNAYLQFGSPFVLKHIVHIGIVEDDFDFTVLDATGLSQFQEPLNPDGPIEHKEKWRRIGEQALDRIKSYVH